MLVLYVYELVCVRSTTNKATTSLRTRFGRDRLHGLAKVYTSQTTPWLEAILLALELRRKAGVGSVRVEHVVHEEAIVRPLK